MKVYVVTGFHLGWDNVCGIFDPSEVSITDLEKVFSEADFYIQLKDISKDLSDWED